MKPWPGQIKWFATKRVWPWDVSLTGSAGKLNKGRQAKQEVRLTAVCKEKRSIRLSFDWSRQDPELHRDSMQRRLSSMLRNFFSYLHNSNVDTQGKAQRKQSSWRVNYSRYFLNQSCNSLSLCINLSHLFFCVSLWFFPQWPRISPWKQAKAS